MKLRKRSGSRFIWALFGLIASNATDLEGAIFLVVSGRFSCCESTLFKESNFINIQNRAGKREPS